MSFIQEAVGRGLGTTAPSSDCVEPGMVQEQAGAAGKSLLESFGIGAELFYLFIVNIMQIVRGQLVSGQKSWGTSQFF